MKCPKCGDTMKNIQITDYINYVKRKLECIKCKTKAVTYEFFTEDIPVDFVVPGTRVLIGDNERNVVPAIYSKHTLNTKFHHVAIDDDGELQGKMIIPITWGVKEL